MPELTYDEIIAALHRVVGRVTVHPRRVHPDQEEADARRIEKAEVDRVFMRTYGDGR